MDIKGQLRIPVYDYDPAEKDPWMLARVLERADDRAGRPVEA